MSTLYRTELEIRIVDVDRRPLEKLSVISAGTEPQPLGAGRYRIAGLPAGRVQIHVEAEGRAAVDLIVEVAGKKQIIDVVLGEPGLPSFKRRGVAGPVTCSVAAFVKSPLRLKFGKIAERVALGRPIDLQFSVVENGRPVQAVAVLAHVFSPATSLHLLAKQWQKEMQVPHSRTADVAGEEPARAQAVREHLRRTSGRDPFQYVRRPIHLVHPKLANAPSGSMVVRAATSARIDGTHNIRVSIEGYTAAGCPFTRVGFRSICVG